MAFETNKYMTNRKAVLSALFLTCFAAAAGAAATDTIAADTIAARQLDEVVVDLPGIVRDKPVNNILEALGYLPGVTNNNGMIGLAGASVVTIILNGEQTAMPLQNLYQLLYTTPVDRLKNVEVMYSAPAKYHCNGAVINVVLKTPTLLDGLQGQVRAGYNQAHYGSYGSALAAAYAVRDWTFDLNYGLSRTKSWSREETWSDHLLDGQRTMIEDDMRRIGRNLSNTIFASVSWKTLKVTYNGQIISHQKSRSLSSGTLGSFTNVYEMLSPVNYHDIALRYVAPFGMTVGADYTFYSENRSKRPLKIKTIPISEISDVKLCSPAMGAIRICGSGGWFGWYGWFKENDLGKYFAYYGKASDCFLVSLKDGRKYMLGCKDAPEMVDAIKSRVF